MNHPVIAVVATGLVAAIAGVAIAGLPSEPPGSSLRITELPATTTTAQPLATTTTTMQQSVTAPVTAAVSADSADEPVETTAPSDGTTSNSTASNSTDSGTNSTDPGDDSTDSSFDSELTPRDELVVIAANAGSRAGIATDTAAILRAVGYVRAVPLDADQNFDTSNVYYRPGLQDEALRMAAELGWSEGDIAPLDQAPAFTTQLDVDLAVVLGQDSR